MRYAIVKIGGSQYRVEEGSKITVEHLPQKEGETVKIEEVLLLVDKDKVNLGKPYVKGASVSVKVLKQEKGEKIDVRKFKAKTGYRRKCGFRPVITQLSVEKIVG